MMNDPVGAVVALPIANWDEVNPGAEPNEARWPVRIQRGGANSGAWFFPFRPSDSEDRKRVRT